MAATSSQRKSVLTFAYITDVHFRGNGVIPDRAKKTSILCFMMKKSPKYFNFYFPLFIPAEEVINRESLGFSHAIKRFI